MEMARRLDLPQTIAVGYELCGTYSINPITHKATFDIPPATSSARIRQFVNDAGSVHGAEKARRAARYVHDNSASPMETALHMHFQLPGVLHGFELPYSELNKDVKLNDKAKKLYPRNSCRCDFYYPDIHQAIEYNGAFHDLQKKDDFKRAAAVEIMGYHSMILTFDTYDNLWALGEVAYNIARKHGIKKHRENVAPTRGRLELHASLKRYYLGLDRTAPEWIEDEALMDQAPTVPDSIL
ncbi:MAG: hypothetical protein J5804_04020, partial [Eggerthellaceae bacterium]|nr:hypothetical protein [Eggerthellaceae bacterium]